MLVITAMNPYKRRIDYLVSLSNQSILTTLGILILIIQLNESFMWFSDYEKEGVLGYAMIYTIVVLFIYNWLFSIFIMVSGVVKFIKSKRSQINEKFKSLFKKNGSN
jgi:large-conductance mechanosensitive channel